MWALNMLPALPACRMIILEDDLEKLMVSGEPAELTYEGYQDLSERLNQLQPHMQASAGCWEDTICQVDRMLRRAGPGERDGEGRGSTSSSCFQYVNEKLVMEMPSFGKTPQI